MSNLLPDISPGYGNLQQPDQEHLPYHQLDPIVQMPPHTPPGSPRYKYKTGISACIIAFLVVILVGYEVSSISKGTSRSSEIIQPTVATQSSQQNTNDHVSELSISLHYCALWAETQPGRKLY